MSCCCPHDRSTARIFSFFARRYRKRYRRKGFEPSQKQLLVGLEKAGFEDKTLLEIGSGVGYLHQHLLQQGAASAVGVDLAPKMLAEARQGAEEKGLVDRTLYIEGDFLDLGQVDPAPADITVLDKVVCCYPDANGLIRASLAHTRETLALTYPRSRWYTRLGARIGALLMALLRSDFRSYVHDPVQIEDWIRVAGFEKTYENHTFIWLTQIYQKPARVAP